VKTWLNTFCDPLSVTKKNELSNFVAGGKNNIYAFVEERANLVHWI
jgi:hypothetical protein